MKLKTSHILTIDEPITERHIGNQTKKKLAAVENRTGNVQSLVERRPIQRSQAFLMEKVIQSYFIQICCIL